MELVLFFAIIGIFGAFILGLHIGCRLSMHKYSDEKRTYVEKVRSHVECYRKEKSLDTRHEVLLNDFVGWVNVTLLNERDES